MRTLVTVAMLIALGPVLTGCGAEAPSHADQQAMRARAAELLDGEPGPVYLTCTWVQNAGLLEGLNEHTSDCSPLIEVPANPAAEKAALFWATRNGTVAGDAVIGSFDGKDVYLERAAIAVPDAAGNLDTIAWYCATEYQLRKEPEDDAEIALGTCRIERGTEGYQVGGAYLIGPDG